MFYRWFINRFLIPLFVYCEEVVDGQTVSIFLGERMFITAIILGLVAIVSFFLLVNNVEEPVVHVVNEDKEEEKISYLEALKGFVKNKGILALALNALFQMIFIASSAQHGTITYPLYFKDGSLSSLLVLTRIVPLVIGSLVGPPLIAKYGKKVCVAVPTFLHLSFILQWPSYRFNHQRSG